MQANQLISKLIPFYRKLPKPLKELLSRLYRAYQWIQQRRSVTTTVDGITYQLDLREYIDAAIYYGGCFEPETTAAINKLCREGMTVIDIGANIGCHTLRFARLVGDKGRVIAFEPMEWALAKLRRNIELNGFRNITIEKAALSDREGSDEGYFRTSWLSGTESDPMSVVKEPITYTTLDSYAERHNLNAVSLIKLDVDGLEFKVLQGAANTLSKYQPLMLMELGPHLLDSAGDDIKDMAAFISSLGYKFYDEATLEMFPDTGAMIESIPYGDTINVVLSARDLRTVAAT